MHWHRHKHLQKKYTKFTNEGKIRLTGIFRTHSTVSASTRERRWFPGWWGVDIRRGNQSSSEPCHRRVSNLVPRGGGGAVRRKTLGTRLRLQCTVNSPLTAPLVSGQLYLRTPCHIPVLPPSQTLYLLSPVSGHSLVHVVSGRWHFWKWK